MREWELLPFEPGIAGLVEQAAAELGLRVTLCDTLASYPGSTHWHFKRAKEKGVVEVTVWPAGNRAWVSVQSGRATPEIEALAESLAAAIRARG